MIRLRLTGALTQTDAAGYASARATHRQTDAESRFEGTPDLCPPPAWMERASCYGMAPEKADRLFFSSGTSPNEALALCGRCPVQRLCADWGTGEAYGVFGGVTADQRRNAQAA